MKYIYILVIIGLILGFLAYISGYKKVNAYYDIQDKNISITYSLGVRG